MVRLPLIVGFGGYNAAGRSSFHQAYQRIVFESLSQQKQRETLTGLAVMMGKVRFEQGRYRALRDGNTGGKSLTFAEVADHFREDILRQTLIRPIHPSYFDVNRVPNRQKIPLSKTETGDLQFELAKSKLPAELPEHWRIRSGDDHHAHVHVDEQASIYLDAHHVCPVQGAGQLPAGFDPAALYRSRFHPRGLQLAIVGASDALNASGLDWDKVLQTVSVDDIGAYSSSVMSQLDPTGFGGLLQAHLRGERASTKQLPLGLSSMVSDFVNAYVLGNLGATGSIARRLRQFSL